MDPLSPIILALADIVQESRIYVNSIKTPEVSKDFKQFIDFVSRGTNKLDDTLWQSRPEMDFSMAQGYIKKAAMGSKGKESDNIDNKILKAKEDFERQMHQLKEVGFLRR